MGRLRKKRGETAVPVEAFSDIAFLLIIFFILVTTFQKQVGFLSEIPSGQQSQDQEQSKETPTVKLVDQRISFNDKFVGLETLRDELQKLSLAEQEPEKRIVLLEATKGVMYQNYFAVMAAIAAADGVVAIIKEK